MTLEFRPAIYRPGQLVEWPRPIPTLRLIETWDSDRFKVPLAQGDTTTGFSRNGTDLTLQGQVGQHHGTLQLTEAAMFATLAELRTALDVGGTQGQFWLLLYYDTQTNCYWHWRNCAATRLELDLSDSHLFTYSAAVHADDPTWHCTVLPLG